MAKRGTTHTVRMIGRAFKSRRDKCPIRRGLVTLIDGDVCPYRLIHHGLIAESSIAFPLH